MRVILSTRNPSKALQIKQVFAGSSITVETLAEAGVEGEAVEESGAGATLLKNARIKALFAHERAPGSIVMADDTGLFVNALGGEPGADAVDWGGKELSEAERARYCLERLRGIPDRSVIFRTTVVVIGPDGTEYSFTGELPGHFALHERVPPQPKMPYSGIFIADGETVSLAEMGTERENAISHRGKAFREVRAFLESI